MIFSRDVKVIDSWKEKDVADWLERGFEKYAQFGSRAFHPLGNVIGLASTLVEDLGAVYSVTSIENKQKLRHGLCEYFAYSSDDQIFYKILMLAPRWEARNILVSLPDRLRYHLINEKADEKELVYYSLGAINALARSSGGSDLERSAMQSIDLCRKSKGFLPGYSRPTLMLLCRLQPYSLKSHLTCLFEDLSKIYGDDDNREVEQIDLVRRRLDLVEEVAQLVGRKALEESVEGEELRDALGIPWWQRAVTGYFELMKRKTVKENKGNQNCDGDVTKLAKNVQRLF